MGSNGKPSNPDYTNLASPQRTTHILDGNGPGSGGHRWPLPDGRVKILFQGALKGKIVKEISQDPLIAIVDIIHDERGNDQKLDALVSVLKEKTKTLSTLTHFFPNDLLKTIDDGTDATRVCNIEDRKSVV